MVAFVTLLASCGNDASIPIATGVSTFERVFVDGSRPTAPNGSFPGSDSRTIRTLFWRSVSTEDGASPPLLILAHGFGGLPEKFDAFARAVASQGFLVAAPAFPLTNQNAPGGHQTALSDLIHQPADLSFLITSLTQEVEDSDLAGQFDPAKIAVLGHSLGGATLLGLTRKDCCLDDRVSATIYVATPTFLASSFGPERLRQDGPPTLILHGTADTSVGIVFGRNLFSDIGPPKILVALQDAGHSEALESQVEPAITVRDAAQRAVVAFLRAVYFSDSAGLIQALAELAAEGHGVDYEIDSTLLPFLP
jgi:predicted dienelactone hydrolase